MVFGTSLLWGAMSPISKIISAYGFSQISVMSYRAVFITVFVGGGLMLKRGLSAFIISRKMLASYSALGIFALVLNATGFVMSCDYLTVPQVLIIHYTFPLLTMAGSLIINKEKPGLIQILAGGFIILGLCVGFDIFNTDLAEISRTGVIWGLISVFGLSAQTLLSRSISKGEQPDATLQLFFSYFIGGIVLIIGKSLFVGWSDLQVMTPKLFTIIQYPAIAAGLAAFWLLFSGLQHIPATTASLICSLEIVFALILTPVLLNQLPSPHELAGCTIILAAVVTSTLSGKKTSKAC